MVNFKYAHPKTAGAFISIEGLYPFALGWEPHNGNIPIFRLGGHVMGHETGWECAVREVKEEANIRIKPVYTKRTYWASAETQGIDLQEIQWDKENDPGSKPFLIVAYHTHNETSLSFMYMAQSNEIPTPSAEVKGILLLDPSHIQEICQTPMTLDQYLTSGGRAIFVDQFDRNRILEPFIQLRIFSQLLKSQWV